MSFADVFGFYLGWMIFVAVIHYERVRNVQVVTAGGESFGHGSSEPPGCACNDTVHNV